MNLLTKILLISLLLYTSGISQQADSTKYFIDKEDLREHLNYLASDEFEGRGTGTEGGEKAAEYLSAQFEALNLIPIGNEDTYRQFIPMHGLTPLSSSRLELFTGSDTTEFKLWEDYLLHNGGDPTYTPNPLPLVFAGYGIFAPEYDYNDYQSIDADGKIVVVLEGEPLSKDPDFFDGLTPTIYSSPEAKRRIAISRGARGIVEIPNLVDDPHMNWQRLKSTYSFEYITLAYSVTANLSLIINPGSAHILFQNSDYTYSDIFRMHKSGRMKSFPLNAELSFKGNFKRRDFVASNIIGMVEGSDPGLKDSYLIITAHYDHLGIGPEVASDSIYNGAYDNAIGVSAVLELAEAISKKIPPLKRSVIFLLVTGEEHGLLGSIYYTDHPIRPLHKTVANINVDGVASFDRFNTIVGVGTEFSTLGKFFEKAADKRGLTVSEIPPMFKKSESFTSSDQRAFSNAGIPSIITMDGTDYESISTEKGIEMFIDYSQKYYHTPLDDLNLPINYDAALQHVHFILSLTEEIANSEEAPEWHDNSPFLNARLRSIAEKR